MKKSIKQTAVMITKKGKVTLPQEATKKLCDSTEEMGLKYYKNKNEKEFVHRNAYLTKDYFILPLTTGDVLQLLDYDEELPDNLKIVAADTDDTPAPEEITEKEMLRASLASRGFNNDEIAAIIDVKQIGIAKLEELFIKDYFTALDWSEDAIKIMTDNSIYGYDAIVEKFANIYLQKIGWNTSPVQSDMKESEDDYKNCITLRFEEAGETIMGEIPENGYFKYGSDIFMKAKGGSANMISRRITDLCPIKYIIANERGITDNRFINMNGIKVTALTKIFESTNV